MSLVTGEIQLKSQQKCNDPLLEELGEPARLRGTRATGTQSYRDPEIWGHRVTGPRAIGTQSHRDPATGTQSHRDPEPQGPGAIGTQSHRDPEIWGHRVTGTQSHRDPELWGHRAMRPLVLWGRQHIGKGFGCFQRSSHTLFPQTTIPILILK